MDTSGEELGRIVAFVNRRPWIMEEDPMRTKNSPDSSSSSSSYFLDNLGTTDMGDSSLHRLCAWHATAEQLQNFLDHMESHRLLQEQTKEPNNNANGMDTDIDMDTTTTTITSSSNYSDMPAPPCLDETNAQGANALHVAVYRNSFHVHSMLQMLLKQQPSLASQQMTCGSTPLHILCAHNVTIRKEVLLTLLAADPSAVWKEDCHGDTPLALLWKNVLRFRWAQSSADIALESDEEDSDSDDSSSNASEDAWYAANGIRRRRSRPRPSWMTVISPDQYIELSLMMVRAALGMTAQERVSLVNICQMPRCPPLLVRLVLQHYQKLVVPCNLAAFRDFEAASDSNSKTALHYAAQVNPVTRQFVPLHVQTNTQSVVDCLLDHFPKMAFEKDSEGRTPLHYALVKELTRGSSPSGNDENNNDVRKRNNNSSTEEIKSFYTSLYRFVNMNPDSLRMKDPVTGLYPFALLAASDECMIGVDKGVADTMEVDCEDPLVEEGDEVHLEAVYRLLRRFPEAAIYRR